MIKTNKTLVFQIFFLLGLGLLIFNSCADKEGDVLFVGDEYQNILQYIDKNIEEFSKFRQLVETAELKDALSSYNSHPGGSNYSVFLPNNHAVELFISENNDFNSFDQLLEDINYVRSLVRYHVINRQILTFDFPNGALNATTLSNDFLTVNFGIDNEGEVNYKINDEATVLFGNILNSNGVIHLIDKMLTPVVYTAYEWVDNNRLNGYQIFAELLDITGLKDTMNHYVLDVRGQKSYLGYTLMVESDDLYNQNGIYSLNDLINIVSPSNDDYKNSNNPLNQFAKYHILESRVFLDQFTPGNFNTFGNFPISVHLVNNDLRFNVGTQIFEEIAQGSDTIKINYLNLDFNASNIVTKTGPIHQLNRILFPFRPSLVTVNLGFYNEPRIDALRSLEANFRLWKEDLSYITLQGVDYIYYTRSATNIPDVPNNDYITVNGNFDFFYQTPRILSGTYELRLMADRNSSNNAMVQVYVNNEKVGGIVNLTSGSTTSARRFNPPFLLGIVTFDQTQAHEIRIKTIKPGRMQLDRLQLTPVSF